MKKKIMFSAVGSNDPCSSKGDGSIVQTIKKVKPNDVYLYFSQQMGAQEDETHVIEKYLERLMIEEKSLDFQLHRIDETHDIAGPHTFDTYYDVFAKQITAIIDTAEKTYGSECHLEVSLNVSSGTPAMKNALFLIASSMDIGQFANCSFTSYQVSAPQTYVRQHENRSYTDEMYTNNPDSQEDHKGKRAEIAKSVNLNRFLLERKAVEFIKQYEYSSALILLQGENQIAPTATALIEYGAQRQAMLKKTFLNTANGKIVQNIIKTSPAFTSRNNPVIGKITDDLYEYLLYMNSLFNNGRKAEYLRALSPALATIFQDALKNSFKELTDNHIYSEINNGFGKLKLGATNNDALKQVENNVLNKLGSDYISLNTIGYLITYRQCLLNESRLTSSLANKNNIYDKLCYLRVIEDALRNNLAHNIDGIEEDISQRIKQTLNHDFNNKKLYLDHRGHKPNYQNTSFSHINSELLALATLIYPKSNLTADSWKDYDRLNEQIVEYIDGTKE